MNTKYLVIILISGILSWMVLTPLYLHHLSTSSKTFTTHLCRTIKSVLVWQYQNERLLSSAVLLPFLPHFGQFLNCSLRPSFHLNLQSPPSLPSTIRPFLEPLLPFLARQAYMLLSKSRFMSRLVTFFAFLHEFNSYISLNCYFILNYCHHG